MEQLSGEVTLLLSKIKEGDEAARERLIPIVYRELRRLASQYLRNEHRAPTIQATALINEVYIRLFGSAAVEWESRKHFYGMAAQAMRHILIDHARSKFRLRAKNSGPTITVSLDQAVTMAMDISSELLDLDEALSRLAKDEPRQEEIVELRFFAGLSEEEIAEILGISTRTVRREWNIARAWLYREISGSDKPSSGPSVETDRP